MTNDKARLGPGAIQSGLSRADRGQARTRPKQGYTECACTGKRCGVIQKPMPEIRATMQKDLVGLA